MGTLLQTTGQLSREDKPSAVRLPRRALDLCWVAIAVLIVPGVLVASLLRYSPDYFRGWINVEMALAFCLPLLGYSRIGLAAIVIESLADLIEPVSRIYYFSASAGMEALQYVILLPLHRLVFYGLSLALYAAAMCISFHLIANTIRAKRCYVSIILALVVVACTVQVCSGRYSAVSRLDNRASHILIIRTPLASLALRSRPSAKPPKPQVIASSMSHLPTGAQSLILDRRMNVVSVLVESWGWINDSRTRNALWAPLTTGELPSRYQVETGWLPFVGPTIYGESRNLCGEIFDRPLQQIDPARLSHCYPAQFAHNGYSTLAIHGFFPHMYARDEWMPRAGFQRELFSPEMARMGLRTCQGGFVGTCDADIAGLLRNRLLHNPVGRPQFIHWTTLDSHLPIQVTPEALARENCSSAPQFQGDDTLCVWYSIIYRLNRELRDIALDSSLPPTVFMLEGDHAPPFFHSDRRSRFSQDHVPFVILFPR